MSLKSLNHTVLYFLTRIISGSIGLMSIYVLTRILSTDEYGNFTLLIAIVTFTSGVSFQWLSISTSRLILEYKRNLYSFVKASAFLFFLSSIVALCIIYMSTYIYPQITKNYFFILLLVSIFLGLYNLLIQLANIVQRPLLYGSLSSSRAIFSLIFSIIFVILFDFHTFGALIGFGMGFLISILLFLFYFKWKIRDLFLQRSILNTKPDMQLAVTLFKYGVPLTFTYLSIMLINVSDRFMLAKMSTSVELSSYSVAYDLAQQTIGLLMNILFLAYFPKIIQAQTKGSDTQLNNLMKQLGIFMFAIAILINLIFINASEGISNIMFGGGLNHLASILLPVISVGMTIGFYKNYYLDVSFQVMKRTDMQLFITMAMAIINIVLNLVLIPAYGAEGASIATLIAFGIGAVMSSIYSKKIMRMPTFISYDILKIICSAFFVDVISYYFNFTYKNISGTLQHLIILTCIYVGLLFICNVADLQKKIFILKGS